MASAPTYQRAVQLVRVDGSPCLRATTKEVPKPGNAEVLIRVYLWPVNTTDEKVFLGKYPDKTAASLPGAVPGSEGASRFKVGQRVVAAPWPMFEGQGTWQQYVAVPERHLVAVPDNVPDEHAAQFWINPMTVCGLFETLSIPQGEWLLQTAAGSVLGRIAIAYAKHRGIKTINVVRRSEQKEELLALGADGVVCSSDQDIVECVKKITGGSGAYGAIDCVGGDTTKAVVSALRPQGTVLLYGTMSGPVLNVNIFDLLYYGKVVTGFVIYKWIDMLGAQREEKLHYMMNLIAQRVIKPYSGTTYPLEQFEEAMHESKSAARGGKVFLQA
ncbi:hypothetical protein WJX72_009314 [[Myrmecia] bisecta]|uniref:Enoyl reductase (ER) domain-containing protein n=1 Tax=[Myrmecia] bisecta TaxID=41462 RepID=A0AAW1R8S2_9CHLO